MLGRRTGQGKAMASEIRIYGLRKCSTCHKAVAELEAAGHRVTFRDVAAEPLDAQERAAMLSAFGERLRNRASLTWRAMSETERAEPVDAQLAARPALMKRPAIIAGDQHLLGWTANVKRALGLAV